MLALRVHRNHLAVQNIQKPHIDHEVLVRVLLSGICNTDLEIARGYAGFQGTIGHEFVGIVEQSRRRDLIGKRVVGEINAGCGKCKLCRSGDPRHCPNRTVLGIVGRDGAHAEFLRLPSANLISVPTNISNEHAVFTEPLAAACGILERVSVVKSDRVVVIGDGKLGLLCAQVLALKSASVTLVGKHAAKLRIAARRGIETVTQKQIRKRNGTFDLAVEASGSPTGFALALDLLLPKGKLILKSTFHDLTAIDASRVVVNEISIIGSRCGRFQPALNLLGEGAIDVDSLISEEFPLVDGVQAMSRAGQRGVLKVLLKPT
jgi:threonine dehydrogenase-like Zn-dependent dehydrogenase